MFLLSLACTAGLYSNENFVNSVVQRILYACLTVALLIYTKTPLYIACFAVTAICANEGKWNTDTPRTPTEWFFLIFSGICILFGFLFV